MPVLVNDGEPYGMGWEAWMAGETMADCPYRAGTASHGKWFRGWHDAKSHFVRRTNIYRFSAQPDPPAAPPTQAG